MLLKYSTKDVDISKAQEIRGWMGDAELRWLARAASECKTVLELGTYRGRSTRAMLDNSDAHITCVDTWNYKICTDKDLDLFLQYVAGVRDRLTILRMTTAKAALELVGQQFDMVFIDAQHAYEYVKADIIAYRPLVRPGGIFCGHDYYETPNPGVLEAVDELVPNFELEGIIWWTYIAQA